jgi:uncharacterized protein
VESREARIVAAIEHAAHYLPDQGPIGVFVHHNTLHAFAHLPFHEAIRQASELLGAEPYMAEDAFRRCHARGRIDDQDIAAAVAESCPDDAHIVDRPFWHVSRRELRRLVMLHPVHAETPEGLRYLLEEEGLDAGQAALWARCRELASPAPARAHPHPHPHPHPMTRSFELGRDGSHRDLLVYLTGEDINHLVEPMLIRLCGAFLDLGMAYWSMPDRDQGFYLAVRSLWTGAPMGLAAWTRGAVDALRAQSGRGDRAMDAVIASLAELGVPDHALERYLTRLVLALPGWAGMMSRLERHPDDRPAHSPPASLLEYVAVRLVLERAAVAWVAREALGWKGPLARLVEHHGRDGRALAKSPAGNPGSDPNSDPNSDHDRAYRLFRVLDVAGISAPLAAELDASDASAILAELDEFDALARRRTFQEAYERHHRRQILDALAEHRTHVTLERPGDIPGPRFQIVVCIDEREESLRRHLEEIEPGIETFGAAGFFGLAMDFRGIDDPHSAALCPVNQEPAHEVVEAPHEDDREVHASRLARRRLWARLTHAIRVSSHSLVRGHLFTLTLGGMSIIPLIARVLFPRVTGRARKTAAELLLPRPRTVVRSALEVSEAEALSERGKMLGFPLDDSVERVASLLEGIGLTRLVAPLVAILGHGSTSLNNPHESAHDCGACSGRRGGPNARVFAEMANRLEVRAGLRARGIDVPDTTWFVGGIHDTSSDAIILYDTDRVPAWLATELVALERALERARTMDAHERCRRFESAGRHITPRQALRHVEARAEHLAEPRPEYGHCTNAVCVVGRRALTRDLFLDRRAFLVSYDPTGDAEGRILERTLAAVGPVGAGINLEYYFSYVDNERYGCGTKLPHNVTALLGVMNGPNSDLRTGLPWQMVEIHEPVRLLTIVEARPEIILAAAERQPGVRELVVNRWIQLVSMDPDSGAMHIFGDHGFAPYQPVPGRLPVTPSSVAWYRGRADHLPPAQIARAGTGTRHAR